MNIEVYKDKIKEVAQKNKLKFVVLFGSYAKGKTHAKSDIDIATYTEDTDTDMIALSMKFYEIFEREDVDLVDTRTASPDIQRTVSEEGVVLYESKPNVFLEWKLYASKIWIETRRFRIYRKERLLQFVKSL